MDAGFSSIGWLQRIAQCAQLGFAHFQKSLILRGEWRAPLLGTSIAFSRDWEGAHAIRSI
jgi:hypothetical protein